jgi:hypothetical protein
VRLTDPSYEDWLEHAFGREVRVQQAAWFFDHDCDRWDPEPAVAVAYLTLLFQHPELASVDRAADGAGLAAGIELSPAH